MKRTISIKSDNCEVTVIVGPDDVLFRVGDQEMDVTHGEAEAIAHAMVEGLLLVTGK